MKWLGKHDMMALLSFLQDIYAIRDFGNFPEQVGSALARLIANDYYVYAEIDGQTQKTVLVRSYPPIESIVPNVEDIFERYGYQNPLLTAHLEHPGALKISDFLTQRQFHRTDLYNELFRPGGVHYQMSIVLPAKPGILRGIVVNRGKLDFSERDRLLLDITRSHLVQARQNAEILNLGQRALGIAGYEIISVDVERRITYSSEGVSLLMSAYFRGSASRDDRLPETVDHWVLTQQALFEGISDKHTTTQPLIIDFDSKRLTFRFLYGGGPGLDDMLLLSERQIHVSPALLTAIGLSLREADVLSLVIEGKSVAEIGEILAIAAGTVQKHLEKINLKLDVHSRAAAVARAFERLRES